LAKNFPEQLLSSLLPLLTESLRSSDWLQVESAILAIGAVATGCFMQMTAYLPQLVPFLLDAVQHAQPLVRSIAAWSLARYSHWVVAQRDRAAYLEPVLSAFLRLCSDTHKKAQEAGISALATFEEAAVYELLPYMHAVVQVLVYAVTHYQVRGG
jgi:transportin-1